MNIADPATLEGINRAGMEEFSEKGFRNASMRSIAKRAHVSTGAIYGYYDSKEELYDALVREQAERITSIFREVQPISQDVSNEEFKEILKTSGSQHLMKVVETAFDHLPETRLLVCHSSGTKYADFIHSLSEMEAKSSKEVRKRILNGKRKIPAKFEHIVVSGMFSSLCELIIHDYPREEAMLCMQSLIDFYMAGWIGLLDE
ncbi:MAG: TetR/AcrR family transcriptional regulator [Clostridiales bacterium]|nr:TetR/AcrR family transcriptional regulator [Clostridiales bacterium]